MGMAKRNAGVTVQREIMDEQSLEDLTQRLDYNGRHPPLAKCLKQRVRCSVVDLKRKVVGCLPILYWLPRYSIWEYGIPDIVSGISVGIMHLPQGMAYALLASLPPVYGLYTSLYPALVYFFFGTSRHISIGTLTVLSIMVGSVTESLVPDGPGSFISDSSNSTAEYDVTVRDLHRVQVAAATTVLAGLIQVVLGLVQFGFVGTYLSEPVVRAYTTAAAAHAVVAQFKHLFGVSPTRLSGPLALIYTLVDVCLLLPETHLPTLAVSGVSMLALIIAKELNAAYRHKLPVPVPVELLTIVAATLISSYAELSTYKVPVIGEIPCGLSPPSVPDFNIFGEVIGDAFAIAIVGYAISISLGKTFALKHGYKVDSNQELVALGLSNTVGGFFQCFAVCPSMSRSLVQESAGGQTQMAGVSSAVIVLVTVLKLGPLFQELPKAVLAAIVIVNLKGMFKQYYDVVTLWRSNKIDLLVWLVTWVSTLLLNLDMGLGASVAFALLTVIFRTQRPRYSVLGHVPGTELYVDMETHKGVREVPGITIFRSSATVYFANAELYLEALKEKSGLDIGKMIMYKRRQEAKQRRRERRARRRARRQAKRRQQAFRAASQRREVFSVEEEATHWQDGQGKTETAPPLGEEQRWRPRENSTVFVMPDSPGSAEGQCSWVYLKGLDPDSDTQGSTVEDGDTATLDEDTTTLDSGSMERMSLGSLGKWTWDIHSIILDLSTVNFIDTVAIKLMKNIVHDFGEIDIDVYMAGCQATVVDEMECGGFFSDSMTKERLFATVHDAVLYCQNHKGHISHTSYDYTLELDISGTRL
ncbi:solute carrier family 26 member 6, like [Alosa sapidissima]|uniref:solute carrier family 26 member 6, like n=1 Tax=Alosa sapidissima TaxID=34773 RepID=UPI001C0984A1|nr:solute carrier family 26 member 6, like [Alosa sapidissima]